MKRRLYVLCCFALAAMLFLCAVGTAISLAVPNSSTVSELKMSWEPNGYEINFNAAILADKMTPDVRYWDINLHNESRPWHNIDRIASMDLRFIRAHGKLKPGSFAFLRGRIALQPDEGSGNHMIVESELYAPIPGTRGKWSDYEYGRCVYRHTEEGTIPQGSGPGPSPMGMMKVAFTPPLPLDVIPDTIWELSFESDRPVSMVNWYGGAGEVLRGDGTLPWENPRLSGEAFGATDFGPDGTHSATVALQVDPTTLQRLDGMDYLVAELWTIEEGVEGPTGYLLFLLNR